MATDDMTLDTKTVSQIEVGGEVGVIIPESSNRGPAPQPPQPAPAPNPRLIVTQPSTDSLHNVVRYNPADPFEGIQEESSSSEDNSCQEQGEGSGRVDGGLRRYGSMSEGLEELIESLNSMVGGGSSESDDEDDYVNQETVDSYVGRSIGEVGDDGMVVGDDRIVVKERPVSEHILPTVSFFNSLANEEADILVPQIKIEVSDGEVLLNSECFSESEFERDTALQVEPDDDIFARSINENIEFFENLNKAEDEPDLKDINCRPTLLTGHHTGVLSDATDKHSSESLDREAMDANLADLDAEIENLRNMTALEGLIGELVADLEGSFSNDPVDSDEVVAVEQLIEMKEKCLREEAERELSRKKRRSRHRSAKQEDHRTRKRLHSESLTEDEREAALLALYSARIHQRKSFNKNFIKILYQSNPDLASRENIVSEAKSLNNSLDRYQLKSYQNAAVLEYSKLKSELISQKRQGKSKKNVKIKKKPVSSLKKKVVVHEKNDLALLVDEIANAFPPNSTPSLSDDLKNPKPPVRDVPAKCLNDRPQKSCPDNDGGGYDSMSSSNSESKPPKPKRKASLDCAGGGYDSMTSEGERKGRGPEKEMDKQAMETVIKITGDEHASLKSNDDGRDKTSYAKRKNSLDVEGGGYDSLTTDDDKNMIIATERKKSLDVEGGGYDSLTTDDEKNNKISAKRKELLEAEGGGYDSLTTDDGKAVKSTLPRKNSLDAEGGGYDSMSDNPKVGVKVEGDGGGYDSMSSDLISQRKEHKHDSEGGGYDTMPDEPVEVVEVSSQPSPPAPPTISDPPPTITSAGTPVVKPALDKTSPPFSRPNVPSEAAPSPPRLPSGPPPTIPDHIPPQPSTDSAHSPVRIQGGLCQDDGYDGDSADDSSFVLSSLSGICDSDLSVFYSDGHEYQFGGAGSDVVYHYDTDPDDLSFSESADRRRSAVALNDYIIGPTDAFHRRTQSIAVMEHQIKKCDSLLDDFDYIQLQQYRKKEALKSTGNKNFTQSTPHLGNIHVTNENTLGGHSSRLAASSYNWEQVRQPDTEEDEDVVTIRFTKTPEQSLAFPLSRLGATIVEDKRSGAILIKRILEESPIAACNKIHPGDELKMINNMPVAGKTVEEVREMLGRLSQDCTLTVSSFGAYPEDRESYTAPKSRYFRAFFNYDPKKDTLNPCKDASFSFELGDILEVVNTEDESWWQAKKYGTLHVGLVPSSDQRLRYLNSRAAKASSENLLYTREHNKKLKKKKDFLFTFGSKDHKEPLTYIEVTHVRPSRSKRRPIIITGAKNFGGSCIRKKLLHNFPDKYSLPIKHTTKTDTDGYKSCSKKEFSALIKQRDLIEYTKSGGHYYGTSYESVRELIVNGKICLLDVHPQYLPVLCNGTLRPHVIFVEAASEERIKELKQTNLEELPVPQRKLHGSDIRELRFNSERLLRRYTEFVDTIITLESLTSAVDLIDQVADRIINHPAWMPRRWLEST